MKRETAQKLSVITSLTGVILAILLLTVFKGCAGKIENVNGGFCYMACHYTVLCGIMLSVINVFIALECVIRKCLLPFSTLVSGILYLILPSLIGICANSQMACHKSALVIRIAGVIFLFIGIMQLLAKGKKDL